MKKIVLALAILMSACSPKVIYKDRVVTVNVPVPQPCADKRPEEIVSLKRKFTDAEWRQMDLVQKTANVGKNALAREQYGKDLNAATGACPEIK